MGNLYYDPEVDSEVVTHSSLKTMRRCPKQYDYKYIQRLKPRRTSKPLKRGSWMHELLEEYHKGNDWTIRHKQLSRKFEEMFDEEKDYYGDLPHELLLLMESYIWYYKDDPWKTIETEFTIEVELPNGVLYRGKVDLLFENQFGLWIGDHKTHKILPDFTTRMLDAQSALYLWAAIKKGYDVQGFVWNYLKTVAPSKPKAIKDGSRLSKVLGDTDYLTYVKEVNRLTRTGELKKVTQDIKDKAAQLKTERYKPGSPQTSPFFRRETLEKDQAMLGRVAAENFHTAQRIMKYPFHNSRIVERVTDRSCEFMCGYKDLCSVELMGGNPNYLRQKLFTIGDPMDYYQDRPEKDNG